MVADLPRAAAAAAAAERGDVEAQVVASAVLARGYGIVRSALRPAEVAALAAVVDRELAAPSSPALVEIDEGGAVLYTVICCHSQGFAIA
jgi:hypothetical protein